MSDAIETIQYKGHTIEIFHDECDWSPRENDNMCVIHLGHRRYSFGDENYNNRVNIDAAQRHAEAAGDICIPFYMYDHSGITISLSNSSYPYNDRWDAGRAGFVQIKKSEILANWGRKGAKNWTEKLRKKAIEVAQMEVEELDSYLRGEVYRYDIDDGEDSCGGYIGDIKYCIEDAKGAVDSTIKWNIKKHLEQLKTWIKNKVPFGCRTSLEV